MGIVHSVPDDARTCSCALRAILVDEWSMLKAPADQKKKLGEKVRSAVTSEHGVDVHHLVRGLFVLVLGRWDCLLFIWSELALFSCLHLSQSLREVLFYFIFCPRYFRFPWSALSFLFLVINLFLFRPFLFLLVLFPFSRLFLIRFLLLALFASSFVSDSSFPPLHTLVSVFLSAHHSKWVLPCKGIGGRQTSELGIKFHFFFSCYWLLAAGHDDKMSATATLRLWFPFTRLLLSPPRA